MKINAGYATVSAIFSAATALFGYHAFTFPPSLIPAVLCGMIAGSHLCDTFGETKAFGETWLDHQFLNAVLAVKHIGHPEAK